VHLVDACNLRGSVPVTMMSLFRRGSERGKIIRMQNGTGGVKNALELTPSDEAEFESVVGTPTAGCGFVTIQGRRG